MPPISKQAKGKIIKLSLKKHFKIIQRHLAEFSVLCRCFFHFRTIYRLRILCCQINCALWPRWDPTSCRCWGMSGTKVSAAGSVLEHHWYIGLDQHPYHILPLQRPTCACSRCSDFTMVSADRSLVVVQWNDKTIGFFFSLFPQCTPSRSLYGEQEILATYKVRSEDLVAFYYNKC